MSSPTETLPLVYPGRGDYQPIDQTSANLQNRRRWMKFGLVAAIASAAIVGVVVMVVQYKSSTNWAGSAIPAEVQVDRLFAGLLVDEKAFYFPMEVSSSASNGPDPAKRFLRALAEVEATEDTSSSSTATSQTSAAAAAGVAAPWKGVDWSYKWDAKDSNKGFAAIGEYYRAKGLSLADFYRSKYDPTYTATSSSSSVSNAPWTADWQADKERGMALGQKYAAIGQNIADHYRQAYDPTYNSDADSNGRRVLKSKEKKKKEDEKKKKRDMFFYDWRADRDRGIAIGQHFKALGEEIAAHYTDDKLSSNYRKENALAIAHYYQQKAKAVQQFYDGNLDMEGMALPKDLDTKPTEDTAHSTTSSVGDDTSYVWGLDFKQDNKHAMDIHNAWMDKGMAIGNYYRSVYDPAFGAGSPEMNQGGNQDVNSAGTGSNEDSLRNPDLDFPPWGQDPEADRAHGIALGEFWAQKGPAIGASWEKKGPELHAYYEDKYRSMFDPTYTSAPASEP